MSVSVPRNPVWQVTEFPHKQTKNIEHRDIIKSKRGMGPQHGLEMPVASEMLSWRSLYKPQRVIMPCKSMIVMEEDFLEVMVRKVICTDS